MSETIESRLEQAVKSVARLQEFDTSQLPRREALGSALSFEDAVAPAQRAMALFQQISLDHLRDLPDQQLHEIQNQADSLFNILKSILEFTTDQPSPHETRKQYIESLKSHYDQTFNALHPKISYLSTRQRDFAGLEREARAAMQSVEDQSRTLVDQLSGDRAEAQRILDEVRKVAAEQGVSQQAIYFREEADDHSQKAEHWQRYTVLTAVGLGAFAACSIFIHKIPFITPTNTYEAIQVGLSKVLVFGVIAYMLVLCARNFLSHKHNAIVNKHRQNALLTFKALSDAAKGEGARDIVLTHAAACIFNQQDTGYTRSSHGAADGAPATLIEVLPKLSSANVHGSGS
ncbi:hypothetical protein [Phyllobacterium zundukense]|uniref:Uncharacterized protein n=1 Tax=Phyllobacterium zundukense TaxID=1867719 RepID=A0A2N9W4W3_9HYPH|nr:hypothetical protein [Phyllobacterium zundukense]ATU91753.1 hypothetical protein BLM14_09075 [Phyllobacterium zundukense]PIO46781.1 hypothetical protein B5P45_03000 [Phyllobacterium zundukense]